MKYNVDLSITQMKQFATDVQKKYVPVAAGIALKRVGNTVRNAGATKIRERLAIKASVAKGAIKVRRIGSDSYTLLIEASGKPIPLRDFGATQTNNGAKFRVSRAGTRKLYKRKGRAGFILQSKGGHVFVRTEDDPPGLKKGRIKKVYGPSIPQYFVTKLVMDAMKQTARERWPIEFSAALRGVLIRKTGVDVGADLSGLGR